MASATPAYSTPLNNKTQNTSSILYSVKYLVLYDSRMAIVTGPAFFLCFYIIQYEEYIPHIYLSMSLVLFVYFLLPRNVTAPNLQPNRQSPVL